MPSAVVPDVGRHNAKRGARRWIPWLILAVGAASTLALQQFSERWIHATAEARLQLRSQELETALRARVTGMGDLLRAVQAYVGQNEAVTPQSWQHLLDTLRIEDSFPGFVALIHLRALKGEELTATVERQRRLSGQDFVVQPPGWRDFHVLITTLAWRDDRYTRPLGADAWSSPVRRVALEAARDSGDPRITGKVDLMTDPEPDQGPTFLIYQAIYRNGLLPDSVPQRRDDLAGFVGVSVRYRALMRQLLPEKGQDLLVQLFDGPAAEAGPARLAYSDPMPDPGGLAGLRQVHEFEVGGRRWTLVTHATGQFLQPLERRFPLLLLVGGALVTLLLFAWSRSQIGQRLRAERLAAEMSRQALEAGERLNTILESVEAHIYIKGRDYRYQYANHHTCALFGRRLEGIVGREDREFFGDRPASDIRANDRRVIEGGERIVSQEDIEGPDGSRAHYLSVKIPLRDAQGQIYALCGTSTDITGLKQVQLELERYRQQLQQMVEERTAELEAATAALREASVEQQAIFDAAMAGLLSVRNRVILSCNRTLEQMFGYDPGELVGQGVRIFHPDDASFAGLVAEFNPAMMTTGSYRGERELVRKDGSRFWARLSARALQPGNLMAGYYGMVQDITAEREMIEELRRARDLAEQATRAKSDFLANMSHEIRTPMNAVLGMTYLALQANPVPPQREYLQKIQKSGQHLLGIINDILDFSKIEAGRLELEPIDFGLERLLNDLAQIVSEQAARKGLEFIVHIDPGVPRVLKGDALRLKQILLNFVSNAVKFTDHGEIAIRISAEAAGDEVMLRCAVTDTGIGLDAPQRAQLFQSFQQADSSITRKYGGTGLGLAISKRLAELMGGEVGVDSAPGRGSTFWFRVRVAIGQDAVEPPRLLNEMRGKRVLVVDDNRTAREVLVAMLRNMDFVAAQAASGAAALGALRSMVTAGTPCDLVVLDWQMPEMDGIATAKAIQRLLPEPIPALLMVTAYGRDAVAQDAADTGIRAVLVKPVSSSTLLEAIMRIYCRAEDGTSGLPPVPSPARPDPGEMRGLRALLVEDNDLNQEVASALLQQAGLVVTIAGDGAIALDKLRCGHYDIVFMDMQMPVMDGIEATRRIRQLPGFEGLPIVAMTANAMVSDRDRCFAAGMNDHIAKPIDPDDLWVKLRRWVKPAARPPAEAPGTEAARPGEEAALPAVWYALEGLDAAAGLKNVLGRPPLYLSLLGKFVDGQRDCLSRIRFCLAQGDGAAAQRLAHTLKGTAAQIGAEQIRALAERLEHAIGHREPPARLDPLQTELAMALPPLIQAIALRLPQAPEEPASARIDTAKLHELCALLTRALNDDDFACGKLLDENEALLRAALGEDFHKIADAIRNYDSGTALACLREAMSSRGMVI